MGERDDEAHCGDPKPEQRKLPRYLVDEDCVLTMVDYGLPLRARVEDLSQEGCRLRTIERFAGRAGRFVEVAFKAQGVAFRFGGVVRWTDGKHRLGIHFENILARRKVDLTEVIEEIASTQIAPSKADIPPSAEQNPSSPGTANSPIAPKRIPAQAELPSQPPAQAAGMAAQAAAAATRRSAESTAEAKSGFREGKVPAPAEPLPWKTTAKVEKPPEPSPAAEPELPADTPPPVQQPSMRRNRRGQSRHEVDTTATIRLVNVGSALRGRILDLSLSGCRIQTDERFPVGIYTRVETEFHLQGLPFRLGGVIQAIHNRFTVGIRFLDLSERKQQQVQELIDEIEEMRAAMPPGRSTAADSTPSENGV